MTLAINFSKVHQLHQMMIISNLQSLLLIVKCKLLTRTCSRHTKKQPQLETIDEKSLQINETIG